MVKQASISSRPQRQRPRSCGARFVALAPSPRHRARPSRRASTTSTRCVRPPLRVCSTCVHRAALAGSTRAPSSHTHRRPRKLRLRCAATHQQRQAPPTELEDRRARRASIAPRTDMFAVLYITAEERAVRALESVAGRGRWAIVRRRRRNGEQRRTRRAAGRHSEAPPHLPRSRREPRHGALEDQYRQRVTHSHTHTQNAQAVRSGTSWSRTAHTRSSPTQSPPSDAPQEPPSLAANLMSKMFSPPHTTMYIALFSEWTRFSKHFADSRNSLFWARALCNSD